MKQCFSAQVRREEDLEIDGSVVLLLNTESESCAGIILARPGWLRLRYSVVPVSLQRYTCSVAIVPLSLSGSTLQQVNSSYSSMDSSR